MTGNKPSKPLSPAIDGENQSPNQRYRSKYGRLKNSGA
jgi:hypothetical protein